MQQVAPTVRLGIRNSPFALHRSHPQRSLIQTSLRSARDPSSTRHVLSKSGVRQRDTSRCHGVVGQSTAAGMLSLDGEKRETREKSNAHERKGDGSRKECYCRYRQRRRGTGWMPCRFRRSQGSRRWDWWCRECSVCSPLLLQISAVGSCARPILSWQQPQSIV